MQYVNPPPVFPLGVDLILAIRLPCYFASYLATLRLTLLLCVSLCYFVCNLAPYFVASRFSVLPHVTDGVASRLVTLVIAFCGSYRVLASYLCAP